MSKYNSHCVIFRTGGTDNFQWHRSLPMSRTEAYAGKDNMTNMGFVAYAEKYELSMNVGLPETYSYNKQIEMQ